MVCLNWNTEIFRKKYRSAFNTVIHVTFSNFPASSAALPTTKLDDNFIADISVTSDISSAFSLKINLEYETENYVCTKKNNLDKLKENGHCNYFNFALLLIY